MKKRFTTALKKSMAIFLRMKAKIEKMEFSTFHNENFPHAKARIQLATKEPEKLENLQPIEVFADWQLRYVGSTHLNYFEGRLVTFLLERK